LEQKIKQAKRLKKMLLFIWHDLPVNFYEAGLASKTGNDYNEKR
jgi:hypothetical protein